MSISIEPNSVELIQYHLSNFLFLSLPTNKDEKRKNKLDPLNDVERYMKKLKDKKIDDKHKSKKKKKYKEKVFRLCFQ